VQGSHYLGGGVEEVLRGALGLDVMMKGGSIDDAMETIARYHFDYSDLSDFEERWVKRVIPFYTWTRKNFPLQLEMMATRPGKYSKYYQAKIEIEHNSERENLVPKYFEDLFGINTGMNLGGGQVYATPDLPFTRSIEETIPFGTEGFEPTKPLGMMTPAIKTPIERAMDHQFFKDIPLKKADREFGPAPSLWGKVPGLMEALSVLDGAKKVNGEWQVKDRTAYTVEQFMPLLGRMRRLAPSEQKYQDRALTSWLSFMGLPLRTNTKAEKEMERFRRALDRGDLKTQEIFVKKGRRAVTVSKKTLREWNSNR